MFYCCQHIKYDLTMSYMTYYR